MESKIISLMEKSLDQMEKAIDQNLITDAVEIAALVTELSKLYDAVPTPTK